MLRAATTVLLLACIGTAALPTIADAAEEVKVDVASAKTVPLYEPLYRRGHEQEYKDYAYDAERCPKCPDCALTCPPCHLTCPDVTCSPCNVNCVDVNVTESCVNMCDSIAESTSQSMSQSISEALSQALAICPVPAPVCSCTKILAPQRLGGENGCEDTKTCAVGSTNATCINKACDVSNVGCDATTTCTSPGAPNYAFCIGDAAWLCYKATCPSDGQIHIQASAVTCCSGVVASGGLYLYKGNTGTTAIVNDNVIDKTLSCSNGDVFLVCEKNSVINTDSLVFAFGGAYQGQCPAGTFSLGCTTGAVSCPDCPNRSAPRT